MFVRIRAAFAIALLMTLISTIAAVAKGGFDFIAITGPNLKETVRVTDVALTEDFFTFANFYEDKTEAPANPGEGYEITRHYIDGNRTITFDRLHYYPETGFVFYDGIENGESEYDGEWYTAKPEIKAVFEAALGIQAAMAPVEEKEPVTSASQSQSENVTAQTQPEMSGFRSLPILITAVAAGLAVVVAFAFGRRKPFTR
ncbi:MAG TPA: hypothetical protein VK897_06095 [Anaerolineales bacterium]|nr:hypothetical protein [Anaerolineales bacterium]